MIISIPCSKKFFNVWCTIIILACFCNKFPVHWHSASETPSLAMLCSDNLKNVPEMHRSDFFCRVSSGTCSRQAQVHVTVYMHTPLRLSASL